MTNFAIVEFSFSKTAAVVPATWLHGPEEEACFWPPKSWSSKKRIKAIQEKHHHDASWRMYDIRVLSKAGVC